MPIPLYISPNTPLPGPADFTSPIISAFQMRDKRKDREAQRESEAARMRMQVSENAKDREQRAGERKETNEYNRGMLDLYKGDRKRNEQQRLQEMEDKANQEYLMAYMKQDQAGMELAQQKIAQLRKRQDQPAQQPAPSPGLNPLGGPGFNPLY